MSRLKSRLFVIILAIVILSLLIACQNTDNTQPIIEPTATSEPEPTSTPIPTNTPIPSPTPEPSPTPFAGSDGGHIAFTIRNPFGTDIYAMLPSNPDDLIQLTSEEGDKGNLAWSPDGSQITFSSTQNNEMNIYVMNADGSNITQLTTDFLGAAQPSWSPDGTKIAFRANVRRLSNEIFVIDLNDPTNPVNITNNPGSDSRPSWSPDGTQIAFASRRDADSIDVYIMQADGSEVTRITEIGFVNEVSWSPDGSAIVFNRFFDMDETNNSIDDITSVIYVVNIDGSNLTQLTDESIFSADPSWSPDGSKVIYAESTTNQSRIIMMNPDGTEVVVLLSLPFSLRDPVWQP